MSKFYEIYKCLIISDTFQKDGAPHLMVTSIGFDTQKNPGAVSFDYKKVYDREDEYKDVAGFYHTHPSGLNAMSTIDIETMNQWVNTLGKSLVCLIETEQQINSWLFFKDDTGEVHYRDIRTLTANDVNYDLWIDPEVDFWDPVDFLTDGGHSNNSDDGPSIFDEIQQSLTRQEVDLEGLDAKLTKLIVSIQQLVLAFKEEKNE